MQPNDQDGPGKTRPRRLLLCLDGVPHKIIERAKERGLFDYFGTPDSTSLAISNHDQCRVIGDVWCDPTCRL